MSAPRVQTIWKWELPRESVFTLQIPEYGQILAVQPQGSRMSLWALVDTHADLKPRRFVVVGTGEGFDTRGREHVGTWQAGPFVWHLFEEKENY